jgi:transposase
MKISDFDVNETIEKAKQLLKEETQISPALSAIFQVLILIVGLMASRLGRNSKNSSTPPSQDPNRARKKKMAGDIQKRKPGGQLNHAGCTLVKTETPDKIEVLAIDMLTIPAGRSYTADGYESRQVVDVNIKVHVTEFRAEVLIDENRRRYVARFPEGVTKAIQYGHGVRAESVYLSMFQLIPLARVQEHFSDQLGLPLSKGSVSNFNQEASERLDVFEAWAKRQLLASPLLHADETGINVGGKKIWLHNLSNEKVTLYHPDEKRGTEAMDRMGVLPNYVGRLCHDHWKPYYKYPNVTHVLCNAHHLRELERVIEEDGHQWAKALLQFLVDLNKAVNTAGGVLSDGKITESTNRYREILSQGENECPKPPRKESGKRGRVKKTFSRNLLERLRDFEADTLRFMTEAIVPFTNNQGENDLRMTKVQQKISGCFRSMDGAKIFCRVRSFLSTCRKNGISPVLALKDLFQGKWPAFMN